MIYNLPLDGSSVLIVILCFMAAELYKLFICKDKKSVGRKLLPIFCALFGALLATIIYFVEPGYIEGTNGYYLGYLTNGLLSGLASTGVHQIFNQLRENASDDNNPFE